MNRTFFALVVTAALATVPAGAQAVRTNPGFTMYSVARNDDGSSGVEGLGFTINLFGKIRTAVYVNNNGNVTFDSALSTYTPFGLKGTAREIIAPFFADVDTRPEASKLVTYGQDIINGHRAFGVNYVDVGYFANHTDKTNSFQLVLIEREDQGLGDFDIEFNYNRITWETGDASGGVNGFGGTPASAGWSNGTDTSYELPGSLIRGAFLDGGPYSLVRQSITGAVVNTATSSSTARAGRLIFRARDGVISPGLVITGGQLPDATVAVPYSQTLKVSGAEPPFRWTLQPDVVAPPGLSLSTAGVLSGVPTTVGTYSFTLGVTGNSEDGEITVYERATVTVRSAAVRITSSCPLPDAYAGTPYSLALGATGSTTGYQWGVRDLAQLPPGLGISASGLLAGTPQVPGTFSFELEAKGAGANGAAGDTTLCRMNVNPASVRLAGGCSLTGATVGVPFSQILRPDGGFNPYTFQLTGDLPQGMAMTSEGSIVGTPGYWGVWIFRIATTDARGTRNSQDCSLTVNPADFSTQVCPLPNATTGVPYNTFLGAGFVWSAIGTLPGGLSLSPDGSVTGIPMVAGPAQFQLLATNNKGKQSVEACSLIVERGPLGVFGCPAPDARVGDVYSALLSAVGGTAPYLFTTAAGSVPPGLSLSTSGRIIGTPTVEGPFSFTVRLREGSQTSTLQACKIQVAPAKLRLATACPLPDGRAGDAYSLQLQAAGGTAPYRYTFGILPDGLSATSAGAISGSPSRVGGRTFNIQLTDASNQSVDSVCSLAVGPPSVPAISLADPPATVSAAATNVSLVVQLAAVYTAPVQGLITLTIQPETGGNDPVVNSPDPQLAFANGQRTTSFTIPAGARSVTVPLASTGTVASTVAVSLSALQTSGVAILQYPGTKFFRLPPAVPSITSACFGRTNTELGVVLDIRVSGFSNTRELTKAQLVIPGLVAIKANIPVPAEFVFDGTDTLNVDVTSLAFGFYSSAVNVRTGGAFTLNIPVSLEKVPSDLAPTAKIGSVSFNLFNQVGGAGARNIPACP
ncbi:MAG: putative Ig domain-containing protein [Acidobacteriota bacterium]